MTKSVVVTGANRGIGLAFCQHYKARGDTVIGVCRSSSEALDGVAEIVVESIDIGDEGDCQTLSDRLSETKIDLLINNAGVNAGMSPQETLDDLDFESVAEQFRINALATLRVTKGLLRAMSDGGKVAIISSRIGSVGDNDSGGRYGYRMSKAALNAAGKSLAIDLKPRGIAVAILHPGYVRTDMTGGTGKYTPEEAVKGLAARIDGLNLSNSGAFWHANGEVLPW